MAYGVHGTLITWQLPGRLCGMWVDTAACGRGAARGGLECKPARRPERKQEGRKEQNTHIEDRNRKAASVVESPDNPLDGFWVRTPRGGGAQHGSQEHCPWSHTRQTQEPST